MAMNLDMFRGVTPGQGLTKSMGSHPFHNPPQYATLDEALTHVFEALTQDRQIVRLCLLLKKGVPAEYIARTVIFIGFSKGMWSPDIGLMMLKSVMSMIIAIAKIKKIKVKIFNPDKEQDQFLDKFLDLVGADNEDEGNTDLQEAPAPANTAAPSGFTGILGGNS